MTGTKEQLLLFKKPAYPLKLQGLSDSDWGSSEDGKSFSGYGFRLTKSGTIILWKTKNQQMAALSTCEGEFIALSISLQEALFLKALFKTS